MEERERRTEILATPSLSPAESRQCISLRTILIQIPLALSVVQELGSTANTVSEEREDPLVKQYITDGMGKANVSSVRVIE